MLGNQPRRHRRGHRQAALLLASIVVAWGVVPVFAAAGPRLELRAIDDAGFPAVRATLAASQRGCEPMTIDRTALTVQEDGRPVSGASLQRSVDQTVPVETLLLLDGGAQAAAAGAQPVTVTAASLIVDSLPRTGSAALLGFKDRLTLLHGSSTDKTALKTALAAQVAEGPSQLLDALDQAVQTLEALEPTCRILVLFTNGADTASRVPIATLVDRLRSVGTTLVLVGAGPDPRRDLLDQLAQTPEVTVLYSSDPAQIRNTYQAAVDRMRTAYTLVYRSQLPADDAPHRLTVRLNNYSLAQAERSFVARSGPLEIGVAGMPEGRIIDGPLTLEVTPTTGTPTRVVLLVDGEERSAATSAPYTLTWDGLAEAPGPHLVTVRAEGGGGRIAERSFLFETPTIRAAVVPTLWPSLLSLFSVGSTSLLVAFAVMRDRRVARVPDVQVLALPIMRDPDVTQEITQPLMPLDGIAYAGAPPARLVRDLGAGRVDALDLTGDEIIIGREPSNAVVLADNQASRRHARLWADDGVYWLEDLQSMNGTLVNGVAITRQSLASGDVVEIGSVAFTFEIPGPEAATTSGQDALAIAEGSQPTP